ncbi:hypothetical protein AOQ84DRAFT_444169 [Glonium stellatum]|uniref:Pheromone alpha factor receptor n=1 Tax=Glonium stellatum TaxID=574774 RepID=A0A8E2JW23_9PEZI|nr:hypothetical protein AOQ84DRAFT_444169 [Glonium stellatum]
MSADNSNVTLPASFDPFAQSMTLLLPDGTPFNISMNDLDVYRSYGIRICINFSSQIGASFMLLVVLLVLTKREKRQSPIFALNALSLTVNTIRSLLQCLYFTGPFYYPYAYFSGDYSKVPQSEIGVSIAADTLTLILVILIEISLILQVRVVCVTTKETQRFWIMVASITVAMVAIGFRFALVVINSEAIRNIENFSSWLWLVNATTITQTISICFFSLIFLIKLGYALVLRRKLGLHQFGPMQIIFIMGCQTMVVPAIFTILEFVSSVPEFVSQVLTVVAIFLPLSAMWAGTSVDNRHTAARGPDAHHKLLGTFSSGDSKGSRSFVSGRKASTIESPTRESHSPLPSPLCARTDSEVGEYNRGIHVGKSFGVRNAGELA